MEENEEFDPFARIIQLDKRALECEVEVDLHNFMGVDDGCIAGFKRLRNQCIEAAVHTAYVYEIPLTPYFELVLAGGE